MRKEEVARGHGAEVMAVGEMKLEGGAWGGLAALGGMAGVLTGALARGWYGAAPLALGIAAARMAVDQRFWAFRDLPVPRPGRERFRVVTGGGAKPAPG